MSTFGAEKVADKRLVEVLGDYSEGILMMSINEQLPRQKGMSDLVYLNMKLDFQQNNTARIEHLRAKAKAVSEEILKRSDWEGQVEIPDTVELEVNLVCKVCGEVIDITKVATFKAKLELCCTNCVKIAAEKAIEPSPVEKLPVEIEP